MINKESISVIIPTYNSARFIGDALKSVLGQTVPPDEIIVVDDGSTDDTQAETKKIKGNIRYVYQQNSGQAAARNKGLDLAEGDLLTFIDADDVWLKDKLELQLDLLDKNPSCEMIIGLLIRIPVSKTKLMLNKKPEEGEHAPSVGSALIKREVFAKIGNFDEEMEYCEDIDFFFRLLEANIKVLGHEDVVQLYRRHDKNITQNIQKGNFYLLRAFKKALDRRKKNNIDIPVNFKKMDRIREFWEP